MRLYINVTKGVNNMNHDKEMLIVTLIAATAGIAFMVLCQCVIEILALRGVI